MSRVLSTPSRPVVNYPWMSYARSTLILKLSKKNGKVSINPRSFVLRSEDGGVRSMEELWGPFPVGEDEREWDSRERNRRFRWKTTNSTENPTFWKSGRPMLYFDHSFPWFSLLNSYNWDFVRKCHATYFTILLLIKLLWKISASCLLNSIDVFVVCLIHFLKWEPCINYIYYALVCLIVWYIKEELHLIYFVHTDCI